MKNVMTLGASSLLIILAACAQSAPASTEAETQGPAAAAQATPTVLTQTPTAPVAKTSPTPDVIYVPTPQPVVDAMLKLARVRAGDVLYDLGSGDGRIPVTAARDYGIRAIGIDIDPQRIAEAEANVRSNKVGKLVTIRQGDLFQADISDASVVTLYLLDSLNEKLRPKLLRDLRPGTRIVSHSFRMGDWEPEASQNINGSMIYLWTVPKRK